MSRDDLQKMREQATPHDAEAERAILGGILLDNAQLDPVAAELKAGDLFVRANNYIYGAMLDLREENSPIDPITLGNKLREQGTLAQVGGIAFISELTYGLPHFSDLKPYVRLVKKEAAKRKMLHLANAIVGKVDDGQDDPEDILAFLDAQADTLRDELQFERAGFRHVSQVAEDVEEDLALLEQGINPGIETGLWLLDDATGGGGRPGELWVAAALTGGGKSALMKQIAHNMAGRNVPVGIITAEMSDKEVFYRFLAPESGVPAWTVNKHLRASQFPKLRYGISQVATLPIWIDDRTTNIFQIRSRVRSLVRQHKVKVLFVDYLQLLDVSAEDFGRMVVTRAQEVAKVSRTLKKLAKELGILVIALAQFNRQANAKVDAAGNPVQAEIHQLAESGGLEKDADLVMIIDMDDYVKGNPERNATIRIGKFRRMPPFPLPYIFNGDYYIFRERDGGTQNDKGRPMLEAQELPRGSVVRRIETETVEPVEWTNTEGVEASEDGSLTRVEEDPVERAEREAIQGEGDLFGDEDPLF